MLDQRDGRRKDSRFASARAIADLVDSSFLRGPPGRSVWLNLVQHGPPYPIEFTTNSKLDLRMFWSAFGSLYANFEEFQEWWITDQFSHTPVLISDFANPSFGQLLVGLLLYANDQMQDHYLECARLLLVQWANYVDANCAVLVERPDISNIWAVLTDSAKAGILDDTIDNGTSLHKQPMLSNHCSRMRCAKELRVAQKNVHLKLRNAASSHASCFALAFDTCVFQAFCDVGCDVKHKTKLPKLYMICCAFSPWALRNL